MSDPMTELFTAALGLVEPWRVKAVRFEPTAHEIYFDLVCEAARLPCPRCKAPDQPISEDFGLRDTHDIGSNGCPCLMGVPV